ncbi:hypothetical protein [Inhella proteolytica]|uniref:Uncharacterized protein n=1 Tax=Inhella proteolytica TaxID=2795029 RepID=A0A931NIJ0_9BURK|nr:hypothetical protein [Inhella proteolytica]MBH9578913.1 hypothetical protein [Inhella proteolytica]
MSARLSRLVPVFAGLVLALSGARAEPLSFQLSYQDLARVAAQGVAPLVWQVQPDMVRRVLQAYTTLNGVERLEVHEWQGGLMARVDRAVPMPLGPRCELSEPIVHEGRSIGRLVLTLRCG